MDSGIPLGILCTEGMPPAALLQLHYGWLQTWKNTDHKNSPTQRECLILSMCCACMRTITTATMYEHLIIQQVLLLFNLTKVNTPAAAH
jgi:hypothetical protein